MAARAKRAAKKEQRASLGVDRQRIIVALEIAIECRVRLRERLRLEGGDGVRGVLKSKRRRRRARIRDLKLL
jgi:hypothetical protein